jgi:signal transduction histidine kinase
MGTGSPPGSKTVMPPATEFLETANRLLTLALTQRSSADFLQEALQEALRATRGKRAFLARIEQETGELVVGETAGDDWTAENRKLRLRPHNKTERGITGYVAITGEPYLCADVRSDPHYIVAFADVLSEIAVPFFDAEGRVRGVLNVDSDQIAAFESHDIAMLATFANGIAASMAFEEFRERERLLVEIGLELASTTDISTLARRVVSVTSLALKCEACSVFLLDEPGESLVLQASSGSLKSKIGVASYRVGEGLTGSVARTGETIRLDDPRQDPRWIGRYPEFSPDELSAFLAVPIPGRERIIGVIRASRPRSAPAWFRARFTESDERVFQTIASQLGNSVDNSRSLSRLVRSERMAAWGELSAKSAHMMGNRTFAIKGDLNELKYLLSKANEPGGPQKTDALAEVAALVESVERGVYKLEDILREFRDFVMATQLKQRDTDINVLIQESLRETFPRRTKIVLCEEYAATLPYVAIDVDKMKRALSELIENAVSFMAEGGQLSVQTALASPDSLPKIARISRLQPYVQIVLADTGPGIAAENKEKIFQPFFSSRVKGMGLGLSIVKGIIDAHQGAIREVGESGEGAQFTIFLPISAE